MSPTASHTGRRADDRRGADPRRGTDSRRAAEVRRSAQDYERELRRQELAIGRSLTSVLPADRPARIRELVEARRVMSGAVRDLQRLTRELEADLGRYSAQRSHTQREVLAYEAVAGEIEEVLLRWEARREQLSATIERGNRRQGRAAGPTGRPATPSSGRPGAPGGRSASPAGRPAGAPGRSGTPVGRSGAPGGRQGRSGGTQGKAAGTQGRNGGAPRDRDTGRDRAAGGQGRTGGRRQGGRRGGPPGRSAGGGGRSEPPRSA